MSWMALPEQASHKTGRFGAVSERASHKTGRFGGMSEKASHKTGRFGAMSEKTYHKTKHFASLPEKTYPQNVPSMGMIINTIVYKLKWVFLANLSSQRITPILSHFEKLGLITTPITIPILYMHKKAMGNIRIIQPKINN